MRVWSGGDKSLVGTGLRKNERRKIRDHAALKKCEVKRDLGRVICFHFLR